MATRFYIVRHGESEANLQDLFAGHYEAPLTERGHRQAELTARFLDQYPLDAAYASDLERARQTAEHTTARRALTLNLDPQLREIFAGEWEGKKFSKLPELFPENFKQWVERMDLGHPQGGESVAHMTERVHNALCAIAARHPGQHVLIVTHGAVLRAQTCRWQKMPDCELSNTPWASNASVTIVDYEPDGTTKLIAAGLDEHLSAERTTLPDDI